VELEGLEHDHWSSNSSTRLESQAALLHHYMDSHGMVLQHTMQKDMIAR
jgi:hypothetical protein